MEITWLNLSRLPSEKSTSHLGHGFEWMNTASHGPASRSNVGISVVRSVNASFVIAAEGFAQAHIKGTTSTLWSLVLAAKKPASEVCAVACVATICGPRKSSSISNFARSVRIDEKVLVLCVNPSRAIPIMLLGFRFGDLIPGTPEFGGGQLDRLVAGLQLCWKRHESVDHAGISSRQCADTSGT
jgi:hypothetical protein